MIRVGFILTNNGNGWVGGVNYLSNLLHAIAKVTDRQIEPVLIVSPSTPAKALEIFPPWQVLRTLLADGQHYGSRLARKLGERLLGRDVLMERFLIQHGIDVLSHSGQLGRRARVPTIGWIPDFQFRRIPAFFQPSELAVCERGCRRISKQCTTVLLSSMDAQHDLAQFDPAAVLSSRVLHFVSGFAGGTMPVVEESILRDRYDIDRTYFHLPNQFWAHKNHRVVIDALALLKARGREVIVLCTGHTADHRWPGYFDELMHHAQEEGVTDCFRVLGLVPYEDMVGLMLHSAGVVNPSLFEGWSTTVEEAKSLGVAMVLSDIAVHREQNPERGFFFDPKMPASLADALETVLACNDSHTNFRLQMKAKECVSERFIAFGTNYQQITLETVAIKNTSSK